MPAECAPSRVLGGTALTVPRTYRQSSGIDGVRDSIYHLEKMLFGLRFTHRLARIMVEPRLGIRNFRALLKEADRDALALTLRGQSVPTEVMVAFVKPRLAQAF